MSEKEFNEWLETQPIEDKIVSMRYKYSIDKEWEYSNEVLEVNTDVEGYYQWLRDWDEGQEDVEILGCINLEDVAVPKFEKRESEEE